MTDTLHADDPAAYPAFAVTVDVAVMLFRDGKLSILLVDRGEDPFRGMLALPGGFKRPDESLDAAAARELFEETGIRVPIPLRQVHAYGDPGRDPRMNVVTICYFAAVAGLDEPIGGTDAQGASIESVADVLNGTIALAFDHRRIVTDVVRNLREEVGRGPLATAFLGAAFTLPELRGIYEAIWGVGLDPGNFHRQFVSDIAGENDDRARVGKWLRLESTEDTGERRPGRRAQRYGKSPRWRVGCPITNPLVRLGIAVAGRRILWVDPHPENNAYARSFLAHAAGDSEQSAPAIVNVATADEAVAELGAASYDLVITHWGDGGGREPAAVQLLLATRANAIAVPVIVFASSQDKDKRRQRAMSLGAKDYCFEFDPLFKRIETVLLPGGRDTPGAGVTG
ncbi:MAG: NUDIX domain-containing protein [Chloroflexi bacterium]|nr:NUDIX domain-containing protein [Chloroflexota bacterium]